MAALQRRGVRTAPAIARDGGSWGLVAAYFLWWIVTTLTSIAPWQSLLGNFGRGLGLLTFGSAILLFPLVRSECRSPRAVRASSTRRCSEARQSVSSLSDRPSGGTRCRRDGTPPWRR